MALPQSGWPRSPCLSLGARACRLPHLRERGPDSSDPFAWPCSSRSPAGKPPARPVAAQKVSRPPPGLRLGLGQVARPGASHPGNSTAEAVGHLASLAKPSRRQPRLAAACLTGPLMAGKCLKIFPQPHRPRTVARSSPLCVDASATPAARLASFDLLRLPCITLRRLHRFRPLRSISVGYTVQTAKTGKDIGGRPGQAYQANADPGTSFPGSPADTATKYGSRHGGRLPSGSSPGPSSLRSSRCSNRRYTPVLADRARGSGETAKQTGREAAPGQPNITARGVAFRRGQKQ